MPRKSKTPATRTRMLMDSLAKGKLQQGPRVVPPRESEEWANRARLVLKLEPRTTFPFVHAPGLVVSENVPSDFVDPAYSAMKRLFEQFDADPNDPLAWYYLAAQFAGIMTWAAEGAKRGRKKEWTAERIVLLEAHAARFRHLSVKEAARSLARKKEFTFTGIEALKKRIAKLRREDATK